MFKSWKKIAAVIFTCAVLVSCSSSRVSKPAALTKTEDRMFWRIDGTDMEGRPSTIYIQGTIHVGDERLLDLSENVTSAFENADRLVAEISTADLALIAQKAQELSQPNAEGKIITDYLTPEENNMLETILQGKSNLDAVSSYDPWIITTAISAGVYQGSGLSPAYALDMALYQFAGERAVEGLDELDVQFNLLNYGTYETQIQILKYTLNEFNDVNKLVSDARGLYESYIADDEKSMAAYIQDDFVEEEKFSEIFKEYHKALYSTRNKDWAEDIINYLNAGGTTFIFAGAGHWVGKDNVFDYLKEMDVLD